MRKITKIVTFYDDGTFEEAHLSNRPITPLPFPPMQPLPDTNWYGNCPKCGLKLGQVMGYVCNNAPCPTGLGGATC
jgi:hypothetical protein